MYYVPFVWFYTALIEANEFTRMILFPQLQSLASIIIVSDLSLTYWVHVIPILLIDNKTMYINIYLPTLHYINLFPLSWCKKVTWHTLQHKTCEGSIYFLRSLQSTNIFLFNGFLSFLKSICRLLNSYSTYPPSCLAWLTGDLFFPHLSTFASFC